MRIAEFFIVVILSPLVILVRRLAEKGLAPDGILREYPQNDNHFTVIPAKAGI